MRLWIEHYFLMKVNQIQSSDYQQRTPQAKKNKQN